MCMYMYLPNCLRILTLGFLDLLVYLILDLYYVHHADEYSSGIESTINAEIFVGD